MRAILLSAGQGRRLLPLTVNDPKCLLCVDAERSALEVQLRAIARCGMRQATVVVGFGADRVERLLNDTPIPGLRIETLYNPVYAVTDNLVTCWMARESMREDFLLLNGDTLFEDRVLRRALDAESSVAVTIDRKAEYDADDMKVSVDSRGKLLAIGKQLPPNTVNGESIGMLVFRGEGAHAFRDAIDRSIRRPEALHSWYLSVVHEIAQHRTVDTVSIEGLWWAEVDSPRDLAEVRAHYRDRSRTDEPSVRVATA